MKARIGSTLRFVIVIAVFALCCSCAMTKATTRPDLKYAPKFPSGHIPLSIAVEKMECDPKGWCDDLSAKLFHDFLESGMFDKTVRPAPPNENADILLKPLVKVKSSSREPWHKYLLCVGGIAPIAALPSLIAASSGQNMGTYTTESTFSFLLYDAKTMKQITRYDKTIVIDIQTKAFQNQSDQQDVIAIWEAKLCAMTEEILSNILSDADMIMLAVKSQ